MINVISVFLLGIAFMSGCSSGGSDSSTPTTNSAPVVTQSTVTKSVTEALSLTYDITSNVTDSDGDSLSVTSFVMADGSALPSGISLSGNDLSVANTISVSDGQNITYDLNATVSDSSVDVTYALQVVIQDAANDGLLTFTLDIATTIDSNETLVGSIVLVDSDGLSSNSYSFELLDLNDSNNSVYTGTMDDVGSDGNYTFSIDLSAQGVGSSHYSFKTSAISPVIGGESPQSDVIITHDFEVLNAAPTWTAASYTTGITVDDTTDAAQTILDLTTVSSDADGDTITYSIVSVTVPFAGEQTIWNNSINIDGSGVLVVTNLTTNNPGFNGDITVKVKATSTGGSSDTDVTFAFNNVN